MKKPKIDADYIYVGFLVLMFLGLVAFIIFRVWVFFTYGDTPVTELPAWVWWIMQSGGKN